MSRFLGFGNGSSGALNLSSYTILKYSCSGTSGASTLSVTGTFSAGDRVFICQMRGTGVGAYEDNQVASYSSGTLTLVHPLENTYTDSGNSQAQVVVVPQATTVTGSLTLPDWDGDVGGLGVFACDTFSGTITGTGKGYRGGAQISTSGYGNYGEGTTGPSAQGVSASANGNGAGASTRGTDVNHGAGGSGGANGPGATRGEGFGGSPGDVGNEVGQADLSTGIFMGGGGSSGAKSQGGNVGLAGGDGGGIVVIYARTFSDSASIINNGSDGPAGGAFSSAGGGGAGGTIFIVTVSGTIGSAKVTATGGVGATAVATDQDGGNGGAGRIRIQACSLSGTTNPTASTQVGGYSYCGVYGGMV